MTRLLGLVAYKISFLWHYITKQWDEGRMDGFDAARRNQG